MPNSEKGFTLLELMVTAVIIGILASIAVPSYFSYLASSRRQDGFSDLYRIMAQQERYYLNNSVYTDEMGRGGLGYRVDAAGRVVSPNNYYATSVSGCTAPDQDPNGPVANNVDTCVRLTATPFSDADPIYWLQSDGQKSDLVP